jgi:copper resistance protein B
MRNKNSFFIVCTLLALVQTALIQVSMADVGDSNLQEKSNWPSPVDDSETYGALLADLLEYTPSGRSGALQWDLVGWRGKDYNRFWFKSEGKQSTNLSNGGVGEIQALYGKMVAPFFDLQGGLAYDRLWGTPNHSASRLQAVLSLTGLSPYSFELEPVLLVSEKGDISMRFTGAKDFLFTQRLILQFRVEANAGLQSVPSFGIGSGLNDLSTGFRLRYEIKRELAPYLGVTWNTLFGDTQRFEDRAGPDVKGMNIVAGLRAWY